MKALLLTAILASTQLATAASADPGAVPTLASNDQVAGIFTKPALNQIILQLESGLAQAQAEHGVIPQPAADAISSAAVAENIPQQAVDQEYARVRHRMVALLNVLRRSLDESAANYLHYGATTVDLYDSARMLQVRAATYAFIEDLRVLELQLIALAEEHKSTPMIGRTLGQHALPITFGKKVSGWIGENRRHIDRLSDLLERVERSVIMKGAVGSYLGLGPEGRQVELSLAKELGLPSPYPDDWHASRDVFAEYASVLALISRTYGRLGQEVFLLQMNDIGELVELRPGSAVGSSTMPHKNNPSRSSALRQHARLVPRLAEVVGDDMINYFERDNTSRPNRVLEDISLETENLLEDASELLARLDIDKQQMRDNLNVSRGWILTQRLVFALGAEMGREHAENRLRTLADRARGSDTSLREAIESDPELSQVLSKAELDALLNPETYLGLDEELVDAVIAQARASRSADPRL